MGGTAISGLRPELPGRRRRPAGPAGHPVDAGRRGRRPGLALAYSSARSAPAGASSPAAWSARCRLLFVGLFLFGGGSAANYQARYAAVDLAEPARRGRQLSLVVWATTIGAVAGPNLAPVADSTVHAVRRRRVLRAVRVQRGRVPARRRARVPAAAARPAADRALPCRLSARRRRASTGTADRHACRRRGSGRGMAAAVRRCRARPAPGSASPRSRWGTWSWSA